MSSDSSHFQLYEDLGWKPYIKRRNYFCYIFIYKCLNKLAANMCHNLFKVKTSEIKTKSIHNKELFLPKPNTKCFQNSIFYSGIKLYNELDLKIRNTLCFKNFCILVK